MLALSVYGLHRSLFASLHTYSKPPTQAAATPPLVPLRTSIGLDLTRVAPHDDCIEGLAHVEEGVVLLVHLLTPAALHPVE